MSKPPFNSGAQPTSTAILYKHFQLVQDKLICQQHAGENQWCWVNPHPPNAGHIPLCLQDVQLWACYLHNHPEDASCTTLPNADHFMKLLETRQPRGTTLIHTPTELIIQPHYSGDNHTRTTATDPYNRGLSRQNAVYLEADGDSVSGNDQCQIKTILNALHATYPALNYPQYEDCLRQQGIVYLFVASMFDVDFYITKVGMVPGAARLFCHWVAEELGRG